MRHIRTLVAVALALSVFLVSETFAYWTSGGESASRQGYSRAISRENSWEGFVTLSPAERGASSM